MRTRPVLVLFALLFFASLAHPTDIPAQAAAAVSTDHLTATIRSLTGLDPVTVPSGTYSITTRQSANDLADVAAEWLHQSFSSLGLNTTYHDIDSYPDYSDNVVAELPGLQYPERVYIICAHYDSVSTGADDNASGTAAVLEAASILSQCNFRSTIRFIAFSGEEQGLRGSADYAADVYAASTDVRGVLNLDMIAYTGGSLDDIDIMYKYDNGSALGLAAQDLAQSYADNFVLYSGLDAENVQLHPDDSGGSDHVSFRNRGYPAIMAIEDPPSEIWSGANPYYHTVNDSYDKLDMDFATAVTRAAVATLADWAVPLAPGDTNFDDRVDGADLALWQQNYDPLGTHTNSWSMGDFNHDGLIDGVDLALWQINYNPTGSPLSLPEPTSLLLLASALLTLPRRIRPTP